MNLDFEDLSIHNKSIFDQIRNDESIRKFIRVADNYYDYLLSSSHIHYKLIKHNQLYVGGLQIELIDDYATFSIEITTQNQGIGIGKCIVNLLKQNFFDFNIRTCKVYVETSNISSIELFTKSGFMKTNEKDNIIEYIYHI